MATNTAGSVARDFNKQMIHYLRLGVTFSDSGTVRTVGVIPAGSQILNVMSGVFVRTVFNNSSANTLDIGTSSTAALYATDLALGTKAFVPLDEAATATNVNTFYVTVDTTITASVKTSGSGITTGAAEIVIAYIPDNDK